MEFISYKFKSKFFFLFFFILTFNLLAETNSYSKEIDKLKQTKAIYLIDPSKPSNKKVDSNLDKLKFTEIIINSKEDVNKVFDIGIKFYEGQKYEDSIQVFKKIIEKFPGYGDAHYYIGLCYFSLGKYYLSISSFLEANKIFGDKKLDALYGAGLAYLSSGYTDEARLSFQKVIKNSSDKDLIEDSKTWLNSIDEQILQREKIDLLTSDLNFREGVEYLDTQNYSKAENAFRSSSEIKKTSLLPLYYLGNTLYLRDKYKEAIETFEKIILIDPSSKIARDARLYIRVIDDFTLNSPNSKPVYAQLSLGALYDSNLPYSDINDTIISDISGVANLSAGYSFNNYIQAQYNYYGNLFSGVNDKTPNLNIHSYDFNLQRHSASLKFLYPFINHLNTESEISSNWYLLGGENFLLNGRLSPKIYFYFSQSLITSIQYILDFNSYAVFKTRNSIDHTLDISQYFYFFDNALSFKSSYTFKKINANDQLLSQTGTLTDGNKYDLIYDFVNSLMANELSLDVGLNTLPFNSKLKLTGKIAFNNYDNDDIYRLTSPITNIATGEADINTIKSIRKKRSDFLYSWGANLSFPIYTNLSSNLFYNYINNTSNMTSKDYVNRSYNKHIAGFNLTYDF